MAKLEVEHLYKIFGLRPRQVLPLVRQGMGKERLLAETGHHLGLTDISLAVEAGSTYVVMGLSGSGKSTLIRCLNRLIEPTAGQVRVDGVDILALSRGRLQDLRRHTISMVFQRFGLLPHRTVLDNVGYGLAIQGLAREAREARARHWVAAVGLAGYEASYPEQLSGGMQQRVGLARALATDPDILLMDEAFSALDPLIRREMQDELLRLQKELHKTIVFITHDLDEALRLGDRIAILKDGRLIQEGRPEDILLRPADDYVSAFVQDVNRGRVLKTALVTARHPTVTLAEGDDPAPALERLRRTGSGCLYVVDARRRLRGVLAAGEGRHGALREVPAVTPDTVLEEVLHRMLHSPWPVAVVDESGVFQGIAPRERVLALLAGEA